MGAAGRERTAARGSVYVRDLVDRNVILACRHDRAGRELLVITLWEDERFGAPRVDHRFTDALKNDGRAQVDSGKRWRERRDGTASDRPARSQRHRRRWPGRRAEIERVTATTSRRDTL